MNQDSLNKFINSRLCFFLFSSVAIIFSYCISRSGELSATGMSGLFFESPDKWLAPGIMSWAVNALLIGAVGLVVFLLNKIFAFIREYTIAYITMFLLSTFANPATSLSLNSSAVMAVILFGCTFVLFGNFQRPDKRSAVFLITLLLVAGSFFSYTHLMFIPLFAFGFMQMQIFSFKGFLAMLAGIAVPLVIATAFGIIDLPAISLPLCRLSGQHHKVALFLHQLCPPALYGCARHRIRAVEHTDTHVLPPAAKSLQRIPQHAGSGNPRLPCF